MFLVELSGNAGDVRPYARSIALYTLISYTIVRGEQKSKSYTVEAYTFFCVRVCKCTCTLQVQFDNNPTSAQRSFSFEIGPPHGSTGVRKNR